LGNSFFYIVYYRGHNWKGITIYKATEVSLQQKFMFWWPKNIFLIISESFKQNKSFKLTLLLVSICSVCLFRATLFWHYIKMPCSIIVSIDNKLIQMSHWIVNIWWPVILWRDIKSSHLNADPAGEVLVAIQETSGPIQGVPGIVNSRTLFGSFVSSAKEYPLLCGSHLGTVNNDEKGH